MGTGGDATSDTVWTREDLTNSLKLAVSDSISGEIRSLTKTAESANSNNGQPESNEAREAREKKQQVFTEKAVGHILADQGAGDSISASKMTKRIMDNEPISCDALVGLYDPCEEEGTFAK